MVIPYTISLLGKINESSNVNTMYYCSDDYDSLNKDIIHKIVYIMYEFCSKELEVGNNISCYNDFNKEYLKHTNRSNKNWNNVIEIVYFNNGIWKWWNIDRHKEDIYKEYVRYSKLDEINMLDSIHDNNNFKLLENVIKDKTSSVLKHLYKENNKFIEQINKSIENDDFELFKSLYQEYISNDKIYNYFSFGDQIASSAYDRSFYKLCTCLDKYKSEEYFCKIHRHLYILPCNCKNGKRYLILHEAYQNFIEKNDKKNYHINYTIKDLIDDGYDLETFNDIFINYIKSDGEVDIEYDEWIKKYSDEKDV